MIDFNKKYKVYFIGVGGVSMHALALFCCNLGWKVYGSDINQNAYTKLCKENGIKVFFKHKKSNIQDYDLIVKSGAVKDANIEIIYANKLGIKVYDRADFLAEITRRFKCVIAVAGTHGKSTTSAMIYNIMKNAGLRVSCHIGADVENPRLDLKDEYLVIEACEYNKTFLKLKVDIAVVLNVESDHLECYGGVYQLKTSFCTFLKHAKQRMVFDCKTTSYLKLKNLERIQIQWQAENRFSYGGYNYELCNLNGMQYMYDAVMSIAVCKKLGITNDTIYKTLKDFKSLPRRNEIVGKYKGRDVIIDYAHHPTELIYLKKSYEKFDTIFVFQPHTYSRTKFLKDEFIDVFKNVKVIIFKEYKAREKVEDGISAYMLYEDLKAINKKTLYADNYEKLIAIIQKLSFDKIMFAGAGDIDKLARKLVQNI